MRTTFIFILEIPLTFLVANMQLKKENFLGFADKKGLSRGPKRVSITLLRTKLKLILNDPLIPLVTKV